MSTNKHQPFGLCKDCDNPKVKVRLVTGRCDKHYKKHVRTRVRVPCRICGGILTENYEDKGAHVRCLKKERGEKLRADREPEEETPVELGNKHWRILEYFSPGRAI